MTVVAGHIIQEGAPTSVTEVARVLGSPARSVIALCQSPEVNRYARFKPYAFGGILPGGMTREIVEAGNFGMEPATIDLYSLLGAGTVSDADLDGCDVLWSQWVAPSGKYADMEPCRLGDFCGYDHHAKADIAGLSFGNKWDGTSSQALRDGWLMATLDFNKGEDFRVYLTDFSYNGVKLEDMYLTILVVKRHFTGAEYRWRYYFAAQSNDPLRLLRPAGSASVVIDLSEVTDTVMDSFMLNSDGSKSSEHVVAVGLAPKMAGIEGGGVPVLLEAGEDGLPELVSLRMNDSEVRSVRYSTMLGTAASSGVVDEERFDVVGYLLWAQNKTTARFVTVNGQRGIAVSVGGMLWLYPSSQAQMEYNTRGRMKVVFTAMAVGTDGAAEFSDERVIVSPVGMIEYNIAISDGVVGDITSGNHAEGYGPMNGVNDATLRPLDGDIFIPFESDTAEVTVYCYTEGYPTGEMYGKRYLPVMIDRADVDVSSNGRWSADLAKLTITR